jgi:NADPH:quinone reductase-like Zn-dependent oxidoreductase
MDQAWKQLSTWMAQGHLHPVIGLVLPMEKVQQAYGLLSQGKNFGKVVVKIG